MEAGPRVQEGLVGGAELLPGVYMIESLVKVENGCIITSITNTTAEEVELLEQVVKLEEIDGRNTSEAVFVGVMDRKEEGWPDSEPRGKVIAKPRDDNLNEEEKKLLREICFEYQDVFYLPGDKLSCTNVA